MAHSTPEEDAALIALFLGEAAELLDALDSCLLDLLAHPDDRDLIDRAFRALHTLKGAAAMYGYDQISAMAHALESVFDETRRTRGCRGAGDGRPRFARGRCDARPPGRRERQRRDRGAAARRRGRRQRGRCHRRGSHDHGHSAAAVRAFREQPRAESTHRHAPFAAVVLARIAARRDRRRTGVPRRVRARRRSQRSRRQTPRPTRRAPPSRGRSILPPRSTRAACWRP